MLSDLLSPYAQWALPSLIVKSLMALIMGVVIRQKSKKQAFITIGISLVVWVCFVAAIKSALSRAVNFSVENLADAMDKSIENVQKSAGDVQLTLTVAIIIFVILISALVYWIVKKKNVTSFGFGMVLGMTSAGTCMIIGYYITEIILYGNPISPVFSVPMNIIQLIMGFVIAIVVTPGLRKAYAYIYGDKIPGDL